MPSLPTLLPTAPANKPKVLSALRLALPATEYAAVAAWAETFYGFQAEWLFEPARFALCNKSRQIGLSHSTAGWGVLRAAYLGETTTLISVGEREAYEVLDKAQKHAKVLVQLGSKWATARPVGEELRFPSGGRLVALPASSGGRSYSGNVVLDEFAYHEGKAEKVWDSAAAVVLHGFCLRVLSTPNGVGDLFHELWTNPKANAGYVKHQYPIEQAVADGMRVDVGECWKMAKGDPRLFAQLFRCSFLDGAEQYIATAAILACVREDSSDTTADRCARCGGRGAHYGGLDVGLENDLSALEIVCQTPDNKAHRCFAKTWKRTDWPAQQAEIATAFRNYDVRRLCVDSTGLGAVPAQLLQKLFGRQRVEPIAFTTQTKETLATTLYQAISDRMVSIDRDGALIEDLCSLKRIVTSTGAVRYDAERSERGHADRAWAFALALHACSQAKTETVGEDERDFAFG